MARLTNALRSDITSTMIHTLFSDRVNTAIKEINMEVVSQIEKAIPPAVLQLQKKHPNFIQCGTGVEISHIFPFVKNDTRNRHCGVQGRDSVYINTDHPHPRWSGRQFVIYLDKQEHIRMSKRDVHNEQYLLGTPELIRLVKAYRLILVERKLAKNAFTDLLDSVNTTKSLLEKWPGAQKYIGDVHKASTNTSLTIRADLAIKLERQAARLAKSSKNNWTERSLPLWESKYHR